MSTHDSPPTRDHSPEDSQLSQGPKKRRRKALSCNDCRRRKLRCDREWPACSRCRAAGQADSCTYDSVPVSVSNGTSTVYPHSQSGAASGDVVQATNGHGYEPRGLPTPTRSPYEIISSAMSKTISNQTQKISQLESKVASLQAPSPAAAASAPEPDSRAARDAEEQTKRRLEIRDGVEAKFFRGRGFKTQFYGATNPTSVVTFFPEISTGLRDISLTDSSFKHARQQFNPLKMRQKRQRLEAAAGQGANIVDLLPSREQCDYYMNLYFETYENIFRILHGPSFWRDYRLFWLNSPQDREDFVAILLMAMSCVRCLEPPDKWSYVADSSVSRLCVMKWVDAVEAWVQKQSFKHLTLASFQVRCLIQLTKYINIIKRKRSWTEVGNLMRFSMSAGLHRDPKSLDLKASPFTCEMRRRLWASMVELELQISITRGMPAAIAGVKCDTEPPLNIDDESFDESSEQLPLPQNPQDWTKTAYLMLSRSSLPLRVSLTSIINDPTTELSFSDVLHYEQLINDQIAAIPRWCQKSNSTNWNTLLPETLLELQLRQFLVLLHHPFTRCDGQMQAVTQSSYSRMACYNNSTIILDHHSRLVRSGTQALNLLRSDVYLAALNISHMMYICHQSYAIDPMSGEMLLRTFQTTYQEYIQRSLKIVEDKLLLLGEGFMTFGMMYSAYGVVRSALNPTHKDGYRQEMLDEIMRLYNKVINQQESPVWENGTPQSWQDQPSFGGIIANTSAEPRGPTPAAPATPMMNGLEQGWEATGVGLGNDNFENHWMLDDLWTFNFLDP